MVTTSSWWEIPYCHRCIEHINRLQRARGISGAGLVIAILVALAVAAISESATAAWIVGLLTAGLGLYLGQRETSRVTDSLAPTCAGAGVAVEHRGWYGTAHDFVFTSKSYVDAFRSANRQKTMSDVRAVS